MARAHIVKISNQHMTQTLYLEFPSGQRPVDKDSGEPIAGRISVLPGDELDLDGLVIPWGNEGQMVAYSDDANWIRLVVFNDPAQSWDYVRIYDKRNHEVCRLDAGSMGDVPGINHSGWELTLNAKKEQPRLNLTGAWKQGLDYNAAVATIVGVCLGAPILLIGGGFAIVSAELAILGAVASAGTTVAAGGVLAIGILGGVTGAIAAGAGIVGGAVGMVCGVWGAIAQKSETGFTFKPRLPNPPPDVAAGKRAIASSSRGPEFSPDRANDGRSGGPGGWAPADSDLQSWWQVDLGAPTSLDTIRLYTNQSTDDPIARMNFAIEGIHVGPSGTETASLIGEAGAVPGPHQGALVLRVTDPTPFRYLRVRKTGAGSLFIAALQAFARPADLAAGRPALASSEWSAEYAASRANDGSPSASGGWSPSAADTQSFWQVDLGTPQPLGRIELLTRQDMDQPESRQSFEIWAANSPDMQGHTVLAVRGNRPLSYRAVFAVDIDDPTPYRYVRVVKRRPGYLFIGKIGIYKRTAPPPSAVGGLSVDASLMTVAEDAWTKSRLSAAAQQHFLTLYRGLSLGRMGVSSVFSGLRNHSEAYCGSPGGFLQFLFVDQGRWCVDSSSFIGPGALVAGTISSVYSQRRRHSEVFFRSQEGFLRHFYVENGAWVSEFEPFLTAGTIAGDLCAVYSDARGNAEVYFHGGDGHLHFLYMNNGTWAHDVGSFLQGGLVAGPIAAVYSPARSHSEVFYRSEDGYLHHFYVENMAWVHHSDSFRQAGRVAGPIAAVYSAQRSHAEVYFQGEDGYLHFLFRNNGTWAHDGGSFHPGGPVAGSIAAVYSPARSHSEAFYRGEDGYLHHFYVENLTWVHHTESFRVAGRVLGPITAVFSPLRNAAEVSFRGEDGQLHFFFVQNGSWVHEQSFLGAVQSVPYTVVSGDSLAAIASRFGVSLQALLDANPSITNPDLIQAGQQITVPSAL